MTLPSNSLKSLTTLPLFRPEKKGRRQNKGRQTQKPRNREKADQNKELSTTVEFHEAGHLSTSLSDSKQSRPEPLSNSSPSTAPRLPLSNLNHEARSDESLAYPLLCLSLARSFLVLLCLLLREGGLSIYSSLSIFILRCDAGLHRPI